MKKNYLGVNSVSGKSANAENVKSWAEDRWKSAVEGTAVQT